MSRLAPIDRGVCRPYSRTHSSRPRGAWFSSSRRARQSGRALSVILVKRSPWPRSSRCVISGTARYSRQSGLFGGLNRSSQHLNFGGTTSVSRHRAVLGKRSSAVPANRPMLKFRLVGESLHARCEDPSPDVISSCNPRNFAPNVAIRRGCRRLLPRSRSA